jgi:hypothetical protein
MEKQIDFLIRILTINKEEIRLYQLEFVSYILLTKIQVLIFLRLILSIRYHQEY